MTANKVIRTGKAQCTLGLSLTTVALTVKKVSGILSSHIDQSCCFKQTCETKVVCSLVCDSMPSIVYRQHSSLVLHSLDARHLMMSYVPVRTFLSSFCSAITDSVPFDGAMGMAKSF